MNRDKEYIAYNGDAFTIEWYFDEKNHSDALEYYAGLNAHERIQLLKLFKRMGDAGEIQDKTNRFLCFFYEGKKIIVTNAFRKKQPKLPVQEKENALKKRDLYINRVIAGDYYD